MTSPRLVLHHPSLQASPTAPLPPLPAVEPLRNLLKTAGQYSKSPFDVLRTSYSHSIFIFAAVSFSHLVWKPATSCAHQVPFPAWRFANDQLLALQLFHTAQLSNLPAQLCGGVNIYVCVCVFLQPGLTNNALCHFQTKVRSQEYDSIPGTDPKASFSTSPLSLATLSAHHDDTRLRFHILQPCIIEKMHLLVVCRFTNSRSLTPSPGLKIFLAI